MTLSPFQLQRPRCRQSVRAFSAFSKMSWGSVGFISDGLICPLSTSHFGSGANSIPYPHTFFALRVRSLINTADVTLLPERCPTWTGWGSLECQRLHLLPAFCQDLK